MIMLYSTNGETVCTRHAVERILSGSTELFDLNTEENAECDDCRRDSLDQKMYQIDVWEVSIEL